MAIQYGNEVKNTPSGYSTRGFRVYAEYYVTQTETSWYVQVRLGAQQVTGDSMSWESKRLYWSIVGAGINTGTLGGTAVKLSNDESEPLTGYYTSATYNRSTSDQTVSITCTLTGNTPAMWHGTSQVTLTFTIPARTSYGVYYNGNGATGGSTGSQVKYYGYNLTLNGNGFTRPGYSFWHWNTNSVNTGTSYNAGGSYSANSGVTLYAIWNPIIYYNANGGSGAPANQVKTYGANATLSKTIPVRDKHDFIEWNTKADGSGTKYLPGGTYTGNGTLTLYAIWKKRATAKCKVNGSWHEGDIKCRVNGSWVEADSLYVKVNGVWVEI